MSTRTSFYPILLLSLVALSLGICVVDLLTPVGLAVWVLYLVPILIAAQWARTRDTYFVAALATLLIALGGFLSPADIPAPWRVPNRLLEIGVIWFAAYMATLYRQMEQRLRAQQATLEEQVQERTADLEAEIGERRALEHSLRASEEKFAKVFNSNPAGIAIARQADGYFLDVNDAFLKLVGYPRAQVMGHTSIELGVISPAARQELAEQIKWQGPRLEREWVLHGCHDQRVDVLLALDAVEIGGESCFIASVIDNRERKRIEADLRASERKYRLLADNASDMVWTRAPDGKLTYVSPSVERIRGYRAEEVMAQPFSAMLSPAELAAAETRRNRYIDLVARGDRVPTERYERVYTHKNGSTVTLDVITAGLYDNDGQLEGFISVGRDATEHKAAEAALAASERKYRLLADNVNDLIWTRDATGAVTYVSPSAERIRGYTPEEMMVQSFAEVMPPEYAAAAQARLERYLALNAQGQRVPVEQFEAPFLHKNGSTVTLDVITCGLYDDDGKLEGLLSVGRDITERKAAEAALAASERKYRMLADNASDLVWTRSPTGEVTYVSPSAERIRGYTAEEMIAQSIAQVVSPAQAAVVQARLERYLALDARGERIPVEQYEAPFMHKNGSTVLLDIITSGLYDDSGKLEGFISIGRDITERKAAEAALAASEARLKAVIESSQDVIWSVDRNYRFLVANPACRATFEANHGKPWTPGLSALDDLAMPETRAFWRPLYDRALAGEAVTVEIEDKRSLGRTFESVLNPIRDVDGGVIGVACRTSDITERLRTEAKVRETMQRVRLAADAAGLGIWNWNFADSSLEWDARMCEIYGRPKALLQQKLGYDLWRSSLHPDDLEQTETSIQEAVRTGEPWQAIFRIVRPDSEVRYIQTSAVVDYDRKCAPLRMIGINRDITEQVAYEEMLRDTNTQLEQRVAERTQELSSTVAALERANAGKDAFMAAVSHELRTPLTGILGLAETLEMQFVGPLNERQLRFVGGIRESGERLLEMVNSILNYTQVVARSEPPELEVCRLLELSAVAMRTVKPKAERKQQVVEIEVEPATLEIRSEPDAIVKVLNALLDNAVKFTPEHGSIGVRIAEAAVCAAVTLEVWDTGIGIEAGELPLLFEPFTQGDQRLAREYEGIGLGLAFVKREVELLGGSVTVESAVGQGSRFVVTLPK